MNDIDSVILTKKVILTSARPITKDEFVGKLVGFIERLKDFLNLKGCKQIGHIKFISTTDGEDYLQVSLLDCNDAPSIKGALKKTFEKISMTLNVIEFGVEKEEVSKKINEEFSEIKNFFDRS